MLIYVVYFRDGAAGMSGPDPSLGSFFKEVSHAPSLPSLPPSEPLADCLQSWTNQLPAYESNLNEYEELLNQIGSSSEQEDDQLWKRLFLRIFSDIHSWLQDYQDLCRPQKSERNIVR